MSHHHHHHHPAGGHPRARVALSLLQWSSTQRLVVAAGLIALLWIAVRWAMG